MYYCITPYVLYIYIFALISFLIHLVRRSDHSDLYSDLKVVWWFCVRSSFVFLGFNLIHDSSLQPTRLLLLSHFNKLVVILWGRLAMNLGYTLSSKCDKGWHLQKEPYISTPELRLKRWKKNPWRMWEMDSSFKDFTQWKMFL